MIKLVKRFDLQTSAFLTNTYFGEVGISKSDLDKSMSLLNGELILIYYMCHNIDAVYYFRIISGYKIYNIRIYACLGNASYLRIYGL